MGGTGRLPDPGSAQLKALDWIPDLVVIADTGGRIVFVNQSADRITGYRPEELVGRKIEILVPVSLRPAHRGHRIDYYGGRTGPRPMGTPGHDFRVRRKDGTEFSADIALDSIKTPQGPRTISVIRNINERRRLESTLQHQALHDPLTGLANRLLFFDRLNQSLLSARRERKEVALVLLDVDDFKAVNDAHGHATGDDVLKEFGVRLGSGLRASDTVARIGGDEFAWILPRVTDHQGVERAVSKQMRVVHRPFHVGGSRLEVSVSAGIALYPHDGRDR
jgi:diguanylate cyclase (GGDEF)-like protein/PAS domain S-box-containing protein